MKIPTNPTLAFKNPLNALVGMSLLTLLAFPLKAMESSLVVYAESSLIDSNIVVTDTGNIVEGLGSDLVRSLLSQAGHSADIRVVPWARLMQLLQTEPNVLGFNMTRTPEREELFHWIGMIRPVSFSLWGLRERIGELPGTLEAARDLKVSAYRSDVVEQYLLGEGFSNLVYVSENYDALSMLQRRRIDLIPYSQFAMEDFMSRSAIARDELVAIFDLEEISTAHYIVMNKNSDPELVEQLKTNFQLLIDSGGYAEILGSSLQQ